MPSLSEQLERSHAEINELTARLALLEQERQNELRARDERIEALIEQLRLLKAQVFGPSSEKRAAAQISPDQARLLFNEAEAIAHTPTADAAPESLAIPAPTRKKSGRKALIPYITAGDPHPSLTVPLMHALVEAGSDILELGVPFSDPLADGPVIQRATERALASGTTLTQVLDLLARMRSSVQAPFVIFSYANPILRLGAERFADRAREAGVDGVLVLDLPIEEADEFRNMLAVRGIDTILLLSPTTTDQRLRKAAALGSGFLYAISRLGVTGARDRIAEGAHDMVDRIRRVSDLPVALGFGISKPEHVREVGQWADAAVVGSALVNVIAEAGSSADLNRRVEEYVRWLKS